MSAFSKLGVSKLGVRKFGLLLPGLALLALVSGFAGFRISEAMGLAELQQTGHQRLDLYGASLEREIDKYAYFPATLGLERDVLDLVGHGAPVAEAVNRLRPPPGRRSLSPHPG